MRMAPTSPRVARWMPWLLTALVFAIWSAAYVRLFIEHTPRIPLLFNWTGSLPYHVAWLVGPKAAYARGDLIVFSFEGEARHDYPGLTGQSFFKRVRGIAGDRITVDGRAVYVNGVLVGTAKAFTFDHRPLDVIASGTIPAGSYFVEGTAPDSFDSRYRASGLVRTNQIIGEVWPWF